MTSGSATESRASSSRRAVGAELAAPAAKRLGCAEELGRLEALLERGDGAREQREAYEASEGNLLAVMQWLAAQTVEHS